MEYRGKLWRAMALGLGLVAATPESKLQANPAENNVISSFVETL